MKRYKISKLPLKRPDILVIDTNGFEYLKRCLPESYSYYCVNIRDGIPVIPSAFFIFLFLKNLINEGFKPLSLFKSIVDFVRPKAILSFTDNAKIMGDLSLSYPDTLVISIQNGVRTLPDDFARNGVSFPVPIYFSFGKYEKDLLEKYRSPVKKIYSMGSLKLGIFLSEFMSQKQEVCNRVCFISQYIFSLHTSKRKQERDMIYRQAKAYQHLTHWSKLNNVETSVALRSKDCIQEEKFLRSFSQESLLVKNKAKEFSSYQEAYNAKVIVAMDSTLAFEMLGTGKKVLFCDMAMGNGLLPSRGVEFLFSNLPDFLILRNLDSFEEFDKKINHLMQMKESKYLKETQEARDYYLEKREEPVHQLIYNFIDNALQKAANV